HPGPPRQCRPVFADGRPSMAAWESSLRLMTTLAATTQQKLGYAIAIVLAVGWLLYIAGQLWRRRRDEPPGSELELAPNRKIYFDDDVLEGKKLDRSLVTALLLLIVIAIGLPLYWSRA